MVELCLGHSRACVISLWLTVSLPLISAWFDVTLQVVFSCHDPLSCLLLTRNCQQSSAKRERERERELKSLALPGGHLQIGTITCHVVATHRTSCCFSPS